MSNSVPSEIPGLVVLAAGQGWVAVDKPSGVLSVPGRGAEKLDSVLTRVRQVFPEAEAPHRLDMDTSGVIVVATDKAAMRYLSRGFELRRTWKRYLARTQGAPADDQGLVDAPIARDWENRPRVHITPEGKPSQTRYQVLHRDAQGAFVELEPLTGRTHQLRVHLAHLGCPIVGDMLYGQVEEGQRLHLHAWQLRFQRPEDGELVHVEAPSPFNERGWLNS